MSQLAVLTDAHPLDRVPRGGRPLALVGRKHPALHAPAVPVTEIDADVLRLALRMRATLDRHPGIAIAAPQVGVSVRLVVGADGLALCNPELELGDETFTAVEECLSIPGRRYMVERATEATVNGVLLTGRDATFTVTGDIARMWQHEHDHLEGILVSDRWPEVHG